jgi:hypothetical protein
MKILMHTPNYVDSISCTIADGLVDLGHKVYNTKGKLNYGEPAPDGSLYDIYLMCDTDDQGALSRISQAGHPRIIVHGHDRWTDYLYAPNSPVKPVPLQHCDIMFVRDLDQELHNREWYPTFPLDYGIERRYLEETASTPHYMSFVDRPVDVMFYGTLVTARRIYYLEKMVNAGTFKVEYGAYKFNDTVPNSAWNQWIHGRYTHNPGYYHELTRAKFIFAPIGAGCSCFRHMEAYAAGCIPLIQKYPDEILPLHKFVDGENCVLWENENELINKVEDYLSDRNKLIKLQANCLYYARNNLLTRHVAQYMLDKIEEVENARDKSSDGRLQ